ncbi:MAG: maltooligosyltrehalose trehalohydrolase [Rhodospirillaceae bacterium]|nr:maltooligosyltrehalose trehalohydrolase [Rhodospirillaceae bacterium]
MTGISHRMPFGAECRDDDSVRFRLWAPGAETVAVVLEDQARRLPMEARDDGWFELVSPSAGPGDRYRFELPDGFHVPDPASRRQAGDVHGSSVVVDPMAYRWRHPKWRGRPWHEAIVYELHVGSFTPEGGYDGVRRRLERLARLGVSAVELMPVADFSGRWNWGYDGVLPFAPDGRYGAPDRLKALVDAAHEQDLMILLDVVYNHFGPEGNYLGRYAPQAFVRGRGTPWGQAIDYSRRPMRDFFIHNAAYWIEEYRFDGLRLDAVHWIADDAKPSLLAEIASAVNAVAGPDRHVHLTLENDDNAAHLLSRGPGATPQRYDAQWNDDFHHAAHVLLTGESSAYYADYVDRPLERLGRALAEGFSYQGEYSSYRDRPRGKLSVDLPPTAFVNFLQNHDQVGNRAHGERLSRLANPAGLKALSAILLLAPAIPLLFMGEEHGALEPFCFFVDFKGGLAKSVREGRWREMARHPGFEEGPAEGFRDPICASTFQASVIDWSKQAEPVHRDWHDHYRYLLAVRRKQIIPRLALPPSGRATFEVDDHGLLHVHWRLGDGAGLTLVANLSDEPDGPSGVVVAGRPIWTSAPVNYAGGRLAQLPPWFVGWFVDDAAGRRSAQ